MSQKSHLLDDPLLELFYKAEIKPDYKILLKFYQSHHANIAQLRRIGFTPKNHASFKNF